MSMDGLEAPKRNFRESDHDLAEFWRNRVEQNQDLTVLVTDSSNDRGTGKTTLALRLAHGMDRTEEGLTTDKVAMDPRPLMDSYTGKPKGSSLVLDESEVGLDKYTAGSGVNRAIRELVSIGRIEEKYLVLNAPADHLVDQDLKSLVDVWILVERRGFANCYRMDWAPHQGHELTHKLGTLEWDAIPQNHQVQEVYEFLTHKKERRLSGEDGNDYIQRSEAQEMVQEARQSAERETRDDMIRSMSAAGLKNTEIANIIDLSPSRISQIVNRG